MTSTKTSTRIRTEHGNRTIRALVAIGAILASIAAADTAAAEPQSLVVRIPAAAQAELRREVARARAVDVRPFVTVQGIITSAETAHARARGRRAPIALYLAKLGPSALMPMLEMLALDAPKGISAKAAPAIRRDLIEAVGLLRDPRALPVLTAILDDTSADEDTTRTAAEAVARLGTDEAATRILRALDASTGARARAILAGMGECRRARVAEAIAARLRTATDDETARVAARSLGRAGNAWAWQTMTDRAEESRVRELAARALVTAFVQRQGEARTAADNALMVVDAPQTPALIEEAKKGASPETVRALDELAARFARNPSR